MRVAMYYSNNDVRIEERATPQIGSGELLVRVEACGICGTDVLEWYRKDKVPLVLGHEIAGVVVEKGESVSQYRAGDYISASHHVPCNSCHYCLSGHHTVCETLRSTNFDPGGFSEFLRLPAINVDRGVYPLPDDMSFEEATFIEPLACVVRGLCLAGFKPGKSVLVIGSGISGLLHIQLALAQGAGRLIATDISDFRLKAAKRFGADAVFPAKDYRPENLREVNHGRLADLVVLCAGAESAVGQALDSVERGGVVLFFAAAGPESRLPKKINDIFWRNEVSLISSYAGAPSDHLIALDLIYRKRVKVKEMITHRLKFKDIGLGFKLVAEAKESIKVIVQPQR